MKQIQSDMHSKLQPIVQECSNSISRGMTHEIRRFITIRLWDPTYNEIRGNYHETIKRTLAERWER